MEAFASYLIKSVTWLAGFALIFLLFLRNERFFRLNRIYLIAGILTSLFFPFVSVHYTVIIPGEVATQTGDVLSNQVVYKENGLITYLTLILGAAYFAGGSLVLILILLQGRSLLKAIRKSEVITLNPVKLIRTTGYTSPFSFFSYVFVNPSISDIETKEIMNHELVHISQKHWFDLVLVQILCIIQWFNPVVWLYARFIRQNHEYLADEVALQRSSDPAIYRAALLNQLFGAPVFTLSNSFSYSLNKKRFNMMKNIIISPYRKMKVLFILPVFALVLYSFAKPDYKYADKNPGTVNPVSLIQHEVKGTIVQKDGTPLKGAIITLQGTTTGTITDDNGSFKIGSVPDDGLLIVSYTGFKPKVIKPVFTSEMSIVMEQDTLKNSDLNISIPPPPPPPPAASSSIESVGTDGKNPPPPPPPPPSGFKVAMEGDKSPLIVIDGKIEKDGLSNIDPESIGSMIVLKDETATAKYGDQGKNGVIELTTKMNMEEKTKPDVFVAVDTLPEFPGGYKAMVAWIISNIKYPAEAARNKITGKVLVSFTVSASGKVKDVSVIRSASPSLNNEARRVISSMPDWKPAMKAGKTVDVQMRVPVEFKLN